MHSADDLRLLSELLDQALDLPESGRSAWLAALQGDAARLGPTLQAMLERGATRETRDWLARGLDFTAIGAGGGGGATAPAFLAGQAVGSYRLLRELGRGGMGEVWLAERTDGQLKRSVALKLPMLGLRHALLVERFARERDILAGLVHPNIARLYDAGVSEEGQPFMALEYVQGTTLAAYCDERRLGTAQRLALFMQVLDAVQYAHTRLVIHRDLKPGNILVGDDGQVRLLDFGVAKLLADPDDTAAAAEAAPLTQLGGQAYTPDYASPEQVRGEPLGTASDVYSLGVVLYELLCGQRPYALRFGSRAQLEQAIVEAEPALPSLRVGQVAAERHASTPQALARELRGELDTIVLKALKKQADARYATVTTLAEDLRRHRDGEPVLAQRDTWTYRSGKLLRRHKAIAGGVTATVLALALGLGTALWQGRVAQQQRDRALALADQNEAVTQFVAAMLSGNALADKMTVGQMLQRSEAVVGKQFKTDAGTRAGVRTIIASYYTDIGSFAKASGYWQQALKDARESGEEEALASALCASAVNDASLGQAASARADVESALALPHVRPAQRAACQTALSQLSYLSGDPKAALEQARQALVMVDAAPKPRPLERAQMEAWLAMTLQANLMAAQALDHYRHALAELDQLGRAEDASTISLLNNYAGALGVAGQPQAALDAMLQVKARMLQGDPGVRLPAYLLSNIALMLNAVGRYDDALAATTDSDFIAAAAQDPNAALYRQVAHARALAEMGRFDEAHREFQALEAALEKTPGLGRSRGPFLYALARLEFLQGHAALARDHLMKLLAVKGQPPEVILSAQQLQPEIDLALGLPEQAEDEARAVLAEAMKPLSAGALSVWVGRGALVLGKVQAARAKWADARRSLSTAVQHLEHTLAATAPALLEARARLKLLDDKG